MAIAGEHYCLELTLTNSAEPKFIIVPLHDEDWEFEATSRILLRILAEISCIENSFLAMSITTSFFFPARIGY